MTIFTIPTKRDATLRRMMGKLMNQGTVNASPASAMVNISRISNRTEAIKETNQAMKIIIFV